MKPSVFAAKAIKKFFSLAGYEIYKRNAASSFPSDFDKTDISDSLIVRPYTMTTADRIYSLTRAIKYIVANGIVGDIVECGVWKGGSIMAAARALLRENDIGRDIYLFDTFEGMSTPTENDVAYDGEIASKTMASGGFNFTKVSLERVRRTVWSVGYPKDKFHFIKGKVEDTIPKHAPTSIALLRLDTDWYDSTMHELVHLYPRITRGGVLIIDDYGHWLGARRATDEYIATNKIPIFLNRIDSSARLAIKL